MACWKAYPSPPPLPSSNCPAYQSRAMRLYTPLCWSIYWSVGPSVRRSIHPSICPPVTLSFFFCGLWPHCSYPNGQVTSNTAPAHLHATGVAVYPALFLTTLEAPNVTIKGHHASMRIYGYPSCVRLGRGHI